MVEQMPLGLDALLPLCPVCRKPVQQPQHAGRPRRWCSDACRMKQSRAVRAVNKAVAEGMLVRPAVCSRCGSTQRGFTTIQGHHADYDRPLDVEWLCGICHTKADRELGRGPGVSGHAWHLRRGSSEIPVAPDTAPAVSAPPAALRSTTAAVVEAVAGEEEPNREPRQLTRRDLRSPYTSEEWKAIVAALRGERARRKVEHLPRADQMAIVDEVLLSLRRPS